jgi:hypothetical protein
MLALLEYFWDEPWPTSGVTGKRPFSAQMQTGISDISADVDMNADRYSRLFPLFAAVLFRLVR